MEQRQINMDRTLQWRNVFGPEGPFATLTVMTVFRAFALAAVSVLLIGCPSTSPSSDDPDIACIAKLRELERVPEGGRAASWYEQAAALNSECWSQTQENAFEGKAIRVLQDGLARYPGDSALMLGLGLQLQATGNQAEALVWFDRAKTTALANLSNPNSAESPAQSQEVLAFLARSATPLQTSLSLIASLRCEQAVEILEQIGAEARNVEWFEHRYAAELCRWQRDGDAIADSAGPVLDEALNRYPESARLWAITGTYRRSRGDDAGALAAFRRALVLLDGEDTVRGTEGEAAEELRAGIENQIAELEAK